LKGGYKRMDKEDNSININKKQIWKYSFFLLIGVLLVGGFFIFTGKDDASITGGVIGNSNGIVEVTTTLQGFKYNPDTITLKEGSTVRLTVINKDNIRHGFDLKQFGVTGSLNPNSKKTVQFVAVKDPTNGQATFSCTQEHGETLTFNII